MGNMGYCRFRNTVNDLQDCYYHLSDEIEDDDELKARKTLIRICKDIVQDSEEE